MLWASAVAAYGPQESQDFGPGLDNLASIVAMAVETLSAKAGYLEFALSLLNVARQVNPGLCAVVANEMIGRRIVTPATLSSQGASCQ